MPRSSAARPATSSSTSVSRSRVVGIGLVELEHGELGVVARREPLVAEHPPDLEHLLEAADHEPLQVQLRCDPQVQVDVERVVVGHEGLGVGPAGDRVQHRRLDLDEAAVLEPSRSRLTIRLRSGQDLAGRARWPTGRPRARRKRVSTSVTPFHLSPKRPAGLGQQHPLAHLHRQLALAGAHHRAAWHRPSRPSDSFEKASNRRRQSSPGRRAGPGPTSRAGWRRPGGPGVARASPARRPTRRRRTPRRPPAPP